MKSTEQLNERFDAFKAAFQSVLNVNPLSGPSTSERAQIRATTQRFKNLEAQGDPCVAH